MYATRKKGFLLLELILAGGIFVIFSTAFVGLLLQTISDDRRSAEFTIAMAYAREGLDLAKFMGKEDFSSLESQDGGGIDVDSEGNVTLSGSSNFFEKYEREITIEPAWREDGDIVESGQGAEDDATKHVLVVVRWDSYYGETESVSFDEYLTKWREPL